MNCMRVTVNFAKFTGVDFVDCMLDCLCFCAQENCQIYDDERNMWIMMEEELLYIGVRMSKSEIRLQPGSIFRLEKL